MRYLPKSIDARGVTNEMLIHICFLEAANHGRFAYPGRHVPWNPFNDKGLLGEDQAAADQRARRKGGSSAKLDPLGMLIMGEMPQINHGTIVPI